LLFGQPHIVERLQVHPELRTRAEPVSEAQRSVAGDRTLAVNDLADAISGHANLPRKLGGAHAKLFKFVGEDFAGWIGVRATAC
jgi:hypothetical protein